MGWRSGGRRSSKRKAARVEPQVEMNPVLLKPEGESRSQLVAMGRIAGEVQSMDFLTRRERLWDIVKDALDTLRTRFDIVVIEGAGSPAEINLRAGDIVNMAVALHANAPVLLAGDIDKGGVFASLYGTLALIDERERELIKGFIINKFRGDIELLKPGLTMFEDMTNVPVVGTLPYLTDVYVPEEDSPRMARGVGRAGIRRRARSGRCDCGAAPTWRISTSSIRWRGVPASGCATSAKRRSSDRRTWRFCPVPRRRSATWTRCANRESRTWS